MRCVACGADAAAGALLCAACGAPLGWSPPPAAIAIAATPPGRALRVVGAPVEFALPGDDFGELLLGRHDLEARPPVVVDIDLGPVAPRRADGFAISRKQARLARRGGKLYLGALGAAQTLVRKGAGGFEPVAAGAEAELTPGDRVAFGSGDSALILELD